NDPFDMSAKLIVQGTSYQRKRRIAEIVREHSRGQDRNARRQERKRIEQRSDEELRAGFSNAYRELIKHFGVHSFAGDAKSIPMWSHYAGNHRGICYVFDVAADPETFLNALSVEYN